MVGEGKETGRSAVMKTEAEACSSEGGLGRRS